MGNARRTGEELGCCGDEAHARHPALHNKSWSVNNSRHPSIHGFGVQVSLATSASSAESASATAAAVIQDLGVQGT